MNNDHEDQVRNILCELIQSSTKKKKFKNTVRLNVESLYWSGIWEFYVSIETKISYLKTLILNELYGEDCDSNKNQHALILPLQKRTLRDTMTVKEESLKNDDEIELIKTPTNPEILIKFSNNISEITIKSVTASLPAPAEKKMICNAILDIQPPEFISDIRKIMISLIEYSLRLMSTKPNAKYIFEIVRRKLMCENFSVSDSMMQQYLHLGASTNRMKFAINCSYNDPFSVTEWLNETNSVDSLNIGLANNMEDKPIQQELIELLGLFHLFLRASFKVCPKAITTLTEMGFKDNEIKKALRYTGNNISEAVEYMIGNIDQEEGAKPGLDVGISETSDIYKVIMVNPDILLPFTDPTVLYGCLSVMDASSFLISSMRFPLIMDLLNTILSTYYTAKCDLVMRQMIGETINN